VKKNRDGGKLNHAVHLDGVFLAGSSKSEESVLHRERPCLSYRSFLTGDLIILKTVGEPYFGTNLSFKVIISQTFS
jgi:hypothetical protein